MIEARSLQRASVSDVDDAWLESTSQKLRTALLGYGLQAENFGYMYDAERCTHPIIGLGPIRVEDIESKRSALLTLMVCVWWRSRPCQARLLSLWRARSARQLFCGTYGHAAN